MRQECRSERRDEFYGKRNSNSSSPQAERSANNFVRRPLEGTFTPNFACRVGLCQRRLVLCGRLVLGDVARDCAGCDRVGAGKIHLSWSAASWEVAILCADHNLIGTG